MSVCNHGETNNCSECKDHSHWWTVETTTYKRRKPKKKTLKQRSNDYLVIVDRTLEDGIYTQVEVRNAWLAGYKAGKR